MSENIIDNKLYEIISMYNIVKKDAEITGSNELNEKAEYIAQSYNNALSIRNNMNISSVTPTKQQYADFYNIYLDIQAIYGAINPVSEINKVSEVILEGDIDGNNTLDISRLSEGYVENIEKTPKDIKENFVFYPMVITKGTNINLKMGLSVGWLVSTTDKYAQMIRVKPSLQNLMPGIGFSLDLFTMSIPSEEEMFLPNLTIDYSLVYWARTTIFE